GGGAAGGARGRHPVPRALPRRVPPLLPHLRGEHRRRAGPPQAPAEVPLPVSSRARQLWRSGEPFIWLTGGALAFALVLVLGLLGLIVANGLGFFWPSDVVRLTLTDGRTASGLLVEREPVPPSAGRCPIKLKVDSRDVYGADFQWVDESAIARREYPRDVMVMERTEWGLLIGTIKEIREGGRTVAIGAEQGLAELERRLPGVARARRDIRSIEKGEVGAINHQQEKIRLGLRRLVNEGVTSGPAVDSLQREMAALQDRYKTEEARLAELRGRQTSSVVVSADDGKEKELPLIQILHVDAPNAMSLPAKVVRYLARVVEFVSSDPRESNTEGGVFPAIFGTVMMVLIMSVMVAPLGVLVATEEGLAAIPRGTREASLALGATKLETTLRVVLPAVMPSILTGLILAMARAAGEVAPLMITGVVKLAPALPIDGFWPFVH